MGDGMLALTWNNHSTTFFKTLSTVRLRERYTDVTLSCEGRFYQLHKLVLSTCSEYFEKIFEQTPCKHPVIVLRDVSCDELEALLNYMYLGSVSVAQNDLSRLIKVAELFQIKGLAVPDEPPKAVENNSLSKRNDTRDRSNSYRNSQPESSRTRTCASDSSDTPVPKRARTSENYMGSEHASQTSSSVLHSNELPKLEDRSRSQGSIGDSAAHEGPDIRASPGIQTPPFEFKIKEEVREEDSDSEDPGSSCAYDAMNESDIGGSYEPRREESQSNLIILPKTEPEDIPPDESSVTQPGLDQETYSENVLGVPGPSDAQGWYSEGDASGGLPGDKGSIGDESQDMHSLFASQQQPQQQQQQSQQQMVPPGIVPAQVHPARFTKRYKCPYCMYTSNYKTHFSNHILVHTGEKPFSCSYCPARFAVKANQKRHERVHTVYYAVVLQFVMLSTSSSWQVLALATNSKGSWRDGNVKIFQCHNCPYSTKNRTHLQHHMLIHTGEKPYVCSYCSASFTFKGSMKRHERTHTGEKPFACSECPYTANQRSCLMNHMQKHFQQTR
ncbi:gastrula zinc finger protein 5-1-like isoform X2 [Macrobrachium nipponense]|uniref:gastrula zinc finger protein 5-1-like isoform X2 n=1 Tax=Macrobrachium nipponense TaxID=159736 RepID=UPI0030C8446C